MESNAEIAQVGDQAYLFHYHKPTKALSHANRSSVEDETTRVRHYTDKSSADKISKDGKIIAKDNGCVYVEDAKSKPLSPKKAEATHKIKAGKGNSYVETDVSKSDIEKVKKPLTGKTEMTIKGDVKLKNEEVVRRK